MSLDRDELAARNMAALLSNPSGPVQANPSSGWGLTNCTPDDVAALAVSLTDALIARLRPAPVAPVADATDPRRTVGAVVRNTPNGATFVVVAPGEGAQKQRGSWVDKGYITLPTAPSDEFVRWATREECARHGIAYVKRGPKGGPSLEQGTPLPVDDGAAPSPAASPAPAVDREGLAKALREAENGAAWCETRPWGSIRAGAKERYLKCADAAIRFLKANGGVA